MIFCALYKLTEPERLADLEAIRQYRPGIEIFTNISSSYNCSCKFFVRINILQKRKDL